MSDVYIKAPLRNDFLISIFTIPIYFAAIGKYGIRMLILLVISILIGFLVEYISFRIRKIKSYSFNYLAWILFPLFFPPVFPLWMAVVSILFGLIIGESFFGGHGKSLASPIAIGLTFAVLSFPASYGNGWSRPFVDITRGFRYYSASVLTIDHPIKYFITKGPAEFLEIIFGAFPQSPANAVPFIVIIIGIILIVLKAVDLRTTISFFITFFMISIIFKLILPGYFPEQQSLFVGSIIPAGFFIIGNNRYSARSKPGRYFTGILTGIMCFVVRNFSSFSEGIFFAVLFGNVFSAIIDEGVLKFKYRSMVN